jgi:hypothetical protein
LLLVACLQAASNNLISMHLTGMQMCLTFDVFSYHSKVAQHRVSQVIASGSGSGSDAANGPAKQQAHARALLYHSALCL